TISDGQGLGTVLDDEPHISISDVTKAEGKRNRTTLFTFTVTLSVPYDQPVTVSFRTADGTATTGDQDYVAKSGTLTFPPARLPSPSPSRSRATASGRPTSGSTWTCSTTAATRGSPRVAASARSSTTIDRAVVASGRRGPYRQPSPRRPGTPSARRA